MWLFWLKNVLKKLYSDKFPVLSKITDFHTGKKVQNMFKKIQEE